MPRGLPFLQKAKARCAFLKVHVAVAVALFGVLGRAAQVPRLELHEGARRRVAARHHGQAHLQGGVW